MTKIQLHHRCITILFGISCQKKTDQLTWHICIEIRLHSQIFILHGKLVHSRPVVHISELDTTRSVCFFFFLLYLIFLFFSFTSTFNMGVWVRAVCFIIKQEKKTKTLMLCVALFWMIRLFYVMRDWPQWFFVQFYSLLFVRPPLHWVWYFTFIAHNVTNDEKKNIMLTYWRLSKIAKDTIHDRHQFGIVSDFVNRVPRIKKRERNRPTFPCSHRLVDSTLRRHKYCWNCCVLGSRNVECVYRK